MIFFPFSFYFGMGQIHKWTKFMEELLNTDSVEYLHNCSHILFLSLSFIYSFLTFFYSSQAILSNYHLNLFCTLFIISGAYLQLEATNFSLHLFEHLHMLPPFTVPLHTFSYTVPAFVIFCQSGFSKCFLKASEMSLPWLYLCS